MKNYLGKVSTLKDTYESTAPTLRLIENTDNGYIKAIACVTKLLSEYLSYTNAKQLMDTEQMRMTAEFILEDYSHLTLADIKLFFKNCMKGKYGSNYNRLDGPTILGWLNTFAIELDDFILDRKQEEHNAQKNGQTIFDAIGEAPSEEVQKHLNLLLHGVECTDDELETREKEKRRADAIRKKVIDEHQDLYNSGRPIEDIDKEIDTLVKNELIKNLLFEYA